jgi:hypothetical protein
MRRDGRIHRGLRRRWWSRGCLHSRINKLLEQTESYDLNCYSGVSLACTQLTVPNIPSLGAMLFEDEPSTTPEALDLGVPAAFDATNHGVRGAKVRSAFGFLI